MMQPTRRRVLGQTLVAGGLLLGGMSGIAQAQPLEKLRLAYASSVPGPDSTFLFAGKQLGFFKEQGIDLEIQTTGGAVAAAGLVASGAMDLALGGLEALPGYVSQGVPMRAIYVYSYRPIFNVGLLQGSKYKSVKDLKGARVGVLSLGSGSIPVLQFVLQEAGLSFKDIQAVPIGLGTAVIAAIKSNQVDALAFHDTAFAAFELQGIHVDLYSSPRLEKGYPGQGILALERTIRDKHDLVQRFLKALTKSLMYATKDPAGATKAFGELHPEAAKNPAQEEALWRERVKISVPAAGSMWGQVDQQAWVNLLDVLEIGGVIKTKPPVDKLFTDEFLKAANDVTPPAGK